VLVADNVVNRELAVEVGAGWVLNYAAPLRAHHLSDALIELRHAGQRGRPDLSARGWADVGELHVAAFRRAVKLLAG
jgi:beta-1,4-mannosyltransferase